MQTPIILSTTAAVPSGGTLGVVDPAALRNPFKGPMWLDEIRIAMNTGAAMGMGICRARFEISPKHRLTNGFVPIWNLGKRMCADEDFNITNVTFATQKFMSWRFPRPLYLPEDVTVSPELYNSGQYSQQTATFRITYVGRSIQDEPVPKVAHVPWAAGWVGVSNVGGTDASDLSNESNLVNPHDQPLYLQRLIGRILDGSSNNECMSIGSFTTAAAVFQYITASIVGSNGETLVRDQTPFATLFHHPDRCWDTHTVLHPHGFYIAYLSELLSNVPVATAFQPMLSIIGHRDVPVEDLY